MKIKRRTFSNTWGLCIPISFILAVICQKRWQSSSWFRFICFRRITNRQNFGPTIVDHFRLKQVEGNGQSSEKSVLFCIPDFLFFRHKHADLGQFQPVMRVAHVSSGWYQNILKLIKLCPVHCVKKTVRILNLSKRSKLLVKYFVIRMET